MELAPFGITVNAIRAGRGYAALRRIRGEGLPVAALARNPSGRDAADRMSRRRSALSSPRLYWMTGNVIGVDGGEFLIGERKPARQGWARPKGSASAFAWLRRRPMVSPQQVHRHCPATAR
jgi:hypothetical protein